MRRQYCRPTIVRLSKHRFKFQIGRGSLHELRVRLAAVDIVGADQPSGPDPRQELLDRLMGVSTTVTMSATRLGHAKSVPFVPGKENGVTHI
jgi:hypothetical protein